MFFSRSHELHMKPVEEAITCSTCQVLSAAANATCLLIAGQMRQGEGFAMPQAELSGSQLPCRAVSASACM